MRHVKVLLAGALVLTSLPFTAGATAPAPRSARPATPVTREEHRAYRARLTRGLPVPEALNEVGAADRGAMEWDEAYLVPAGDLDGVKGDDFVDVRYHVTIDDTTGWSEAVTLAARRGTDGSQLWTTSLPAASYVVPLVSKVGVDGKRGVLIISYDWVMGDADDVDAAALDLTALAFAGATGTPLWATRAPGAYQSTPATDGAVADTVAAGLLDGVTGAAGDVLLSTATYTEYAAAGYSGAAVQPSLLDGATGAIRPLGVPAYHANPHWFYEAVGDLDKDGLDDVVVVARDEAGMSLSGISSLTGATLWTNTSIPMGYDWWTVGVPGDATGDGAEDLTVAVPGPEAASGAVTFPVGDVSATAVKRGGPAVVLVNGATGKTAWSKRGHAARGIGDADRKKGSEVVVVETLTGNRSGFVAGAYTGTGKRLWSLTRQLKTYPSPYASSRPPWQFVADVHGDGVTDLYFSILSRGRSGGVTDHLGGVVNGRSGKVTKDVRGTYLFPTSATFDGKGADAFQAFDGSRSFLVIAHAGDTRAPLWGVEVPVGGYFWRTSSAFADSDKCSELVLGVTDGETFTDVVMAGRSGRPLWGLTRNGTAAARVTKPSPLWNAQYRRTC